MKRESVVFFLNGKQVNVGGEDAFRNLSEFLRYQRGLTGTKVVCAEGDCGACTVLISRHEREAFGPYQTLNSCIAPVFSLDRCEVLTVEGLKQGEALHPVQSAMVEAQGSQCGYCTPGFICSLAALVDEAKLKGMELTEKRVRNHLTGNLCRCTGYEPILKAGCSVRPEQAPALSSLHDRSRMEAVFGALPPGPVGIAHAGRRVHLASGLTDALEFLSEVPEAKVISGSTDLGVAGNKRGVRPANLLGLYGVSGLSGVSDLGSELWVGARATLAEVEAALEDAFPEFSRSLHLFASPQIKSSGTLVGNLMNASPIGDTIPFLRVADAAVELQGARGVRRVSLQDFVKPGYKQLDLRPGELVTGVFLPKTASKFKIYKVSNRKDLDISTVAFAARYRIEREVLVDFALALGGVGPSVLRMPKVEAVLTGARFTRVGVLSAADVLQSSIQPLSDVRGTDAYRRLLCRNLLLKFHDEVSRDELGVSGEVSV